MWQKPNKFQADLERDPHAHTPKPSPVMDGLLQAVNIQSVGYKSHSDVACHWQTIRNPQINAFISYETTNFNYCNLETATGNRVAG